MSLPVLEPGGDASGDSPRWFIRFSGYPPFSSKGGYERVWESFFWRDLAGFIVVFCRISNPMWPIMVGRRMIDFFDFWMAPTDLDLKFFGGF